MNEGNSPPLPPEVRDHLQRQPDATRRRIEQVWSLMGSDDEAVPQAPGLSDAWDDLQRRLAPTETASGDRPAPDRPATRRRGRRIWTVGIAGAVSVVLLTVVWWRQPVTVSVPAGRQLSVTLPDGSTVQLNSASRLQYARQFQSLPFVPARYRAVTLDGEAFFDVVPNGRPFSVETANARVDVLGTRFNVRARPVAGTHETWVTLASGRVRAAARDTAYTVLLDTPGQEAHITDIDRTPATGPLPVRNLEHVLAWQQQGFVAVDQPLASILAEIERRFATSIEIRPGLVLDDSMTLLYLHGATAEAIVKDVCLSQGCRYRVTSRGFALLPDTSTP